VLEDVSFTLSKGEKIAVVGPNGAGKTTLFKVIAGILEPGEGVVRVSGHDPGGHICISYVPQRSNVDWSFPVTVADVAMMGRIGKLGFFRWPQPRDWQFVHQALETVGLQDLAQRQIGELSGGQQQRMFIARALAQEAELMLMDEPMTGLDVPAQESILQVIETLQSQNVTVLVSMHDLKMAAEQFDRVMLLNKEILGFGVPEEVFTQKLLLKAYGGHLHFVEGDMETLAISDSCCEGEDDGMV
jgi:manganese/iron transport system ATP-binding protein